MTPQKTPMDAVKEALEYYGDRKNWPDGIGGATAREALALLSEYAGPQDQRVDDLAMIVKRFAHKAKNHNEFDVLRGQALDYLKRKGLEGSIIRDEYTEGEAALRVAEPDGCMNLTPGEMAYINRMRQLARKE